MDKKNIIEFVNGELSGKRRVHTEGVVREAISLARHYGASEEKAEIAALCHDIYRGKDIALLNEFATEMGLPDEYIDNPNLSHGKIAEHIMRETLGMDDDEILNAVSYHTTGRAGMSLLEKIIYIADAIEPGRDYPGVEKLRDLAYTDIDEACRESLRGTINHLKENGTDIHGDTIAALAWFNEIRKEERMNSREMADFAIETLSKKKAENLILINIAEKSSFADYLVLATGGSQRQLNALAEEIEDKMAMNGIVPRGMEGRNGTGWILIDLGDIVVNIFSRDMRDKYSIEKVWGDCPMEEFKEEPQEETK